MNRKTALPGRNDPCPCGSGRKYKKCCLLADQAAGDQLAPRRLNRCSQEAADLLMDYAGRIHGPDAILQAWRDSWASDEGKEWSPDDPYTPLFVPWFIYHWVPDDKDDGHFPSEHTVAAHFLRKAARKADEATARYIEAARQEPLTFWQVESVEPGKGLLLRDLLTQRECFAHERSASHTLTPADITFGHVFGVGGVLTIEAMGPYALPPARFRKVLEDSLAPMVAHLRRDGRQPAPTELLEYDLDFIYLYKSCVEDLLQPALPEFRNSDGDKLEWASSTYRFDPEDRGRLIGRLEALRNIERSEVVGDEVEFAWLSQRRNAPIEGARKARIEVGEESLVTECNSRKRDRDLRQRLTSRLGDLLSHEHTTHTPVDLTELIEHASELPEEEEPACSGALDLEGLPPEARERLEGLVAAQHMRWADMQIPALSGQTPRQAVRTSQGREEVEKLIADQENAQTRDPHAQFRFDFNKLRGELGLPLE